MTPLSKHPDYLAAVADHNELATAAAKGETRIREIELMLNSEADSPLGKDAARVENALHFSATGEVKGLGNDPIMLREEHVLLREQRDALKKAIVAKFESLTLIERRLSADITKAYDAQHRALAAKYAELLEQADAVVQEEHDLIASIHRQGYEAAFQTLIDTPLLSRISDKQSVLGRHHGELCSYGKPR